MDRLTRKDLKHDRFVEEVGHTVEFLGEHRRQAIRIGAAALVVMALVAGFLAWRRYQQRERQQALATALDIRYAPVGSNQAEPGARSFPTQEARDKATVTAFSDLAARYPGTREGSTAEYYLGVNAAEKGDLAQAEKRFRTVVNEGDKNYASLAALSLADIYRSQGKIAEGEKLLRQIMSSPTDFVSKEQAQLALGLLLSSTRPEEARKLLEPLRTDRGAVSRAAISAVGELNLRR